MGAVVAAVGDRVRRPGRARLRRRRIDALVGIHGRVGQRGQRVGRVQHAAEELVGERATGRARRAGPRTGSVAVAPERDVGVAAVAGQLGEGLRHEGRAQAVLLGERLHHVLEERVPIGGDQRVVVLPSSSRTGRSHPRGRSDRAASRAPAWRRRSRRSGRSAASAPAGRSRASPAGRPGRRSRVPSAESRKNSHSTPVFSS